MIRIEKYQPQYYQEVLNICYQASSNKNVPQDYRTFKEYVFCGFYLLYSPETCYIALDDDHPVGYVVSCQNEYYRQELGKHAQQLSQEMQGYVTGVADGYKNQKDYQYHLHINVLPEYQHQGIGSRMIRKVLRNTGLAGVILGVRANNYNAINFYLKNGFKMLQQSEKGCSMGYRSEIRKTKLEELSEIMKIYDSAKEYMHTHGNPHQWINGYPDEKTLIDDITQGNSYLIIHNEEIAGVFTLIFGRDPHYEYIKDGQWLDDKKPYGTIHRIATSAKYPGILNTAVQYGFSVINNLRIDTHADNKTMQRLASENGFTRCGIVFMDDGSERIAYQKIID